MCNDPSLWEGQDYWNNCEPPVTPTRCTSIHSMSEGSLLSVQFSELNTKKTSEKPKKSKFSEKLKTNARDSANEHIFQIWYRLDNM